MRFALRAFSLLMIAGVGLGLVACRPAPPADYPPPPAYVTVAVEAHFGDLGPYVTGCMTAIAWRESHYVAEAVSSNGQYLGLVQINRFSGVWPNMAANYGRPLNPFDPWDNLAAARSMFDSWRQQGKSGFTPWSTRGGCR